MEEGIFFSAKIVANFEYNRFNEYFEQQEEIKRWFEDNISPYFESKFEHDEQPFFLMYKDETKDYQVIFYIAVFTLEEELKSVLDEILNNDSIESTSISIYDSNLVKERVEVLRERPHPEELQALTD